MSNAIIVSGQPVYVGREVRVWTESGLGFEALGKRERTTAVVLHWTGGSGLASQVYRTLKQRRLSVHFVIEPDGAIHQHCDSDRRCAHAGSVDDSNHDGHQLSANASTIGIEIVNPAGQINSVRGVKRELVRETIHGRDLLYTMFTAEQVKSALALTEPLCRAYGLPFEPFMKDGRVWPTVMSESEYASFRGVLGHFQLTRRKTDCGLALLRAIAASGHVLREPPEDVA